MIRFDNLDPPTDVVYPNEEEEYLNETLTTESLETTTMLTTTATTTTITTMPTTTITSPQTTLALLNREQSSKRKSSQHSSRIKNSSTNHWFQTQHKITIEPIQVNYTDRSKLDLCDGFYDAITMYKGILFIFKGQVRFVSLSLVKRIISFCFSSIFGNMIDAV